MRGDMQGSKIIKDILYHMQFLRNIVDDILNYMFYKEFKENSKKIKKLHNKHKGQRCFIVATGPSINKTNFKPIKNEIIFGVNSLYKGLDKFDIDCDYYAVADRRRWINDREGIMSVKGTVFLFYIAARYYLKGKRKYEKEPLLVKGRGSILKEKKFPEDISKYVYVGGASIVISCLQMAYYMGFEKVYLLGCDCDYSGESHFDKQKSKWFGKKEKQHWENVFKAYKICKNAFENDNRKIYNATVGGKLEIFERKKLEDVINERQSKTKRVETYRHSNEKTR
jgi:hypothetical protein